MNCIKCGKEVPDTSNPMCFECSYPNIRFLPPNITFGKDVGAIDNSIEMTEEQWREYYKKVGL